MRQYNLSHPLWKFSVSASVNGKHGKKKKVGGWTRAMTRNVHAFKINIPTCTLKIGGIHTNSIIC